MNRRVLTIVTACCAFALLVSAAPIDGKWLAVVKAPASKKQGGPTEVQFTLDLQSSGNQLTGTISRGPGRRARAIAVENGKIENGAFSFTTTQKGRKGETTFRWQGTIQGDEMKGTRFPRRGRRVADFTARRQS